MSARTADEFKTALVERYVQPVQWLHSRAELERLLEEKSIFKYAAFITELMEQLQLIVAKLGERGVAHGDDHASDLSIQGRTVCAQLLEYSQRLPLSLPQAILDAPCVEKTADQP